MICPSVGVGILPALNRFRLVSHCKGGLETRPYGRGSDTHTVGEGS